MAKRPHRPRRTSGRLRRIVWASVSAVLGLAALVALGVGLWAWLTPRPETATVARGVPLSIGASPLFDEGTTLFAPFAADEPVTPADLDCLLIEGTRETALLVAADPDDIGSRVIDGLSLHPVVEIGPTRADDRLLCRGRALDGGGVRVLPTRAAPSSTPLSVVIAGLGLAGAAILVNPAVRGRGELL